MTFKSITLQPHHLLVPQLEVEGKELTVCFHSPTKMSSIQDAPGRMLTKLMANPGAPLRRMPMVNTSEVRVNGVIVPQAVKLLLQGVLQPDVLLHDELLVVSTFHSA